MKEKLNVLVYFSYILKTYGRTIQKSMKDSPFSPNEINLLLFLANNKADTAKEFVKETGSSKSLVTRSVDSLVEQNYLFKEPDQNDRRYVHLKLTPKGEEIALVLRTLRKDFMKSLVEDISEEEFLTLQNILEKMKISILCGKDE